MKKNKIPCFLHIPRCGGTYLQFKTCEILRLYGLKNKWNNRTNWNLDIRTFSITLDSKVILTAIVYDKTNIHKTLKPIYGNYCNTVEYKNFLKICKEEELFISSISIESEGFDLISKGFFNKFFNDIEKEPIYYTSFRDPFQRAISIFNYLNETSSFHEPTHKAFKSNSLEEYLCSYELEDSWLIRSLSLAPYDREITDQDLEKTCQILNSFIILDISKIDELIYKVFCLKYTDAIDILDKLKEETQFYKNKSQKQGFLNVESISEQARESFFRRKKYDILLYDKYIK